MHTRNLTYNCAALSKVLLHVEANAKNTLITSMTDHENSMILNVVVYILTCHMPITEFRVIKFSCDKGQMAFAHKKII